MLEVSNIDVFYGRVQALRTVSISVDAGEIVARLKAQGVLISALGPQVVRACTHLDISRNDCHRAIEAMRGLSSVS